MACKKQLLEPKRANRRAVGLRILWFRAQGLGLSVFGDVGGIVIVWPF